MSQFYVNAAVAPPPSGEVLTLTGNNTGVAVGPTPGGNINIIGAAGSGITVTGVAADNTLTITNTNAGFTWVIQPTSITAVPGFGYFADGPTGPTGITVTLPAVSAIGDTFKVYNWNGNGFEIAQGAGQFIQIGKQTTTTGVTGNIVSTQIGDVIELVCSVANTQWQATDFDGNLIIS